MSFLSKIFKIPRHRDRTTPFFSAGFTLIEMLVSIAIFSFVMLATTSVLLSVIDANHKAQGLKTAIDNLSLALESMTRDLRTGSNYQCGGCANTPSSAIAFTDHDGCGVVYGLSSGGYISISKTGGNSSCKKIYDSQITAPEITIDHLNFYVDGESLTDNVQPRVLITVGGVVNGVPGAKEKTKSRFDIQTFVSQRLPDVPRN